MAISDSRLLSYDGQTVTFRWRDREHKNRLKTAKLDGPTFCQRFLQQVLPNRFVRIRRYGLLSNRVRKSLLARCRDLLGADTPAMPVDRSRAAAALRIFGRDPELCPVCREGRLIVLAEWRPNRLPFQAMAAAPRAWSFPRAP